MGVVIIIVGPGYTSSEDWNAMPITKAIFAFDIIWFIATFFLLPICLSFYALPKAVDRKPYKILTCATFSTFVYYIIHAVWVYMKGKMHVVIYDRMVVAIGIFYAIALVLQPAAALSILYNLSVKLKAEKRNTAHSLVSRPWERAFDCVLVVITFLTYIAALSINAAYISATRSNTLSTSQAKTLSQSYEAVGHTLVALVILLSIDIVFSSIALSKEAKRVQWTNKALGSFEGAIVPFSIIYAILWLVLDVYFATNSPAANSYNAEAANFAKTFVEGFCRSIITLGLLITMELPERPRMPQNRK